MYEFIQRRAGKEKYDYYDVRIEETNYIYFSIENGELEIRDNYIEGMGVRVLNKGSWGFASINEISKSGFEEIFLNAHRLSKIKLKEKTTLRKYKKQHFKEKKKKVK